MTAAPWRTVALVARRPGLLVLRDALLKRKNLGVIAVMTHSNLPKAEGGGLRPDLPEFEEICREHGIPFHALNPEESKNIDPFLPEGPLDLLVSLSWRNLVKGPTLARFSHTINLHRGALPHYPGAKPVERAIKANERRVAITGHEMTEEIDAGCKLAEAWHDIDPAPENMTAAEYAEVVKKELEPLYAPLTSEILRRLEEGRYGSAQRNADRPVSPADIQLTACANTEDDALRIMLWRNDPAARLASFNKTEKFWESFWLEYQKEYFPEPPIPGPAFITLNGKGVGFLRFRAIRSNLDLPEEVCDISITIDPDYRDMGIGFHALLLAKKLLAESGVKVVVAEILPENTSSFRVFTKAGFVYQGLLVKPGMPDDVPVRAHTFTVDLSEGATSGAADAGAGMAT